jgi:predicted HAD superfamily Cof-like phosphohydrolase
MKKQLDKVAEFHKVFKQEDSEISIANPSGGYDIRHALMKEENDEYLEACVKGDVVEIADALGDQLYILCGTILKHGMQHIIEYAFDEIHRSNMSKLNADGTPMFREDGKILKGPNYSKPDLKQFFH